MTTQPLHKPSVPAARSASAASVAPAVVGVAYTVSWIAGLSVPVPSPKLTASGSQIVAALAGHASALIANFVLTEGLPAVGLFIVSAAIARHVRNGKIAMIAGAIAAAISFVQCFLGVGLAHASAPGTAHTLFELVNRLDGAKMLALAAFAVTVVLTRGLPAWLRYLSGALAVSIIGSGIAYLFLLDSLSILAYVAGVLLLAFIPAAAIVVRRAGGR
jgi:hypothetical protein